MTGWSYYNNDNFIRNQVTFACSGWGAVSLEVRRIASSPVLPVNIDDVMFDLRADDEDDDADRASVERMYRTACGYLEKASACVALRGTFEAILPGWWTGEIEVRRYPIREIISLEGLTAANTWTAVPADQLYVEPGADAFRLKTLSTFTAPTLWSEANRTRLRFEAGFDDHEGSGGTGTSEVLNPIQEPMRGILMAMTAHLYQNRELLAADKMAEVELGLGSLLGSVRTFW